MKPNMQEWLDSFFVLCRMKVGPDLTIHPTDPKRYPWDRVPWITMRYGMVVSNGYFQGFTK